MSSSSSSRSGLFDGKKLIYQASAKPSTMPAPLSSRLKLSDYAHDNESKPSLRLLESDTPGGNTSSMLIDFNYLAPGDEDMPSFIKAVSKSIIFDHTFALFVQRMEEIEKGVPHSSFTINREQQLAKLKDLMGRVDNTQLNSYDLQGGLFHFCCFYEVNPLLFKTFIDLIEKRQLKLNLSIVDWEKKTALSVAVRVVNPIYVKELLRLTKKNDPSLKIKDKRGFNALDYALALGQEESFKLLRPYYNKKEFKAAIHKALHLKEEDLVVMLAEVVIHPFRDSAVHANALCVSDIPYYDDNETYHLNTPENFDKIFTRELSSYPKEHQELRRSYTGKSVLDACLQGRAALFQSLLNMREEVELSKPNLNQFFANTLTVSASIISPQQTSTQKNTL